MNEIPEYSVSFIEIALGDITDDSQQTIATSQSINFELFFYHSINIAARYEIEVLKRSLLISFLEFPRLIGFNFFLNTINKQYFVIKFFREVS